MVKNYDESPFLGIGEGKLKEWWQNRDERREERQDNRSVRKENRQTKISSIKESGGGGGGGIGGFLGGLLSGIGSLGSALATMPAQNNNTQYIGALQPLPVIEQKKDYTLLIAGSIGAILLIIVIFVSIKD